MNEAVGEKKITLGGKDWVLRPSFQAVVEAEGISKRGLLELFNDFRAGKQTMLDVLAVVYSCMKAGNEGVPSQAEVGEMLYKANYLKVAPIAFSCVIEVLNQGEAVEAQKKT